MVMMCALSPATSHALRREVEQVWSRPEDASTAGLTDDERAAALATLECLEHNLAQATANQVGTDLGNEVGTETGTETER